MSHNAASGILTGRTGTLVCTWLIDSDQFESAQVGHFFYIYAKAQSHFYPLPLPLTPPPCFEGEGEEGEGGRTVEDLGPIPFLPLPPSPLF
jgi:hypothetical protein